MAGSHFPADGRDDTIGLRILVASERAELREEVRRQLAEAMPCVVHVVSDAALCAAALHEQQYDVVVSDAVTHGFSDPMLLRMARDTQPTALRVGLLPDEASPDPAQRDAALAMVTHLAFAPDDLADLGRRVHRAATLQQVIDEPRARTLVAQCTVLPAAPALYSQLAMVLSVDDVPLHAVAEVVGQDPEVAARILQLTNSAFTGRRRSTSDLSEAVAYVGASTVRGLVLTMEVLRAFRRHTSPVVLRLAEEVSLHGQTVAETALLVDPSNREGYTAGLLHDIGKLVLAADDPAAWERVEARVAGGETHRQAELAVYGTSHDAVGASLLATWGLGEDLTRAVAFHHRPAELGDDLTLAGVIHVADALSYQTSTVRRLDVAWIERADLLGELESWRQDSTARWADDEAGWEAQTPA